MTSAADNLHDRLVDRLTGPVDRATASALAEDLLQHMDEPAGGSAILALLDELQELSRKIAQNAVEALTELRRRGALEAVIPWLDLGVALAGSSGAAAMKYFKESPLILGLIEPESSRRTVLAVGLELAETDSNIARDFLRKAPELLAVLPASDLPAWAEVGVDLSRVDYVLAIEFFRESPSVARVIPFDLVRDWVRLGAKLITPNSLGKPDYVGTLEFFRASPALFGDVDDVALKKVMVAVGSTLADRAPALAVSFLAECPSIIRALPSEEWRRHALQYAVFVAERDPESALAYLRRCPDIVAWVGSSPEARRRFDEWFKGGMEVLAYSAEGARAYFAVETHGSLASIEQALNGVPLRQVARSLKLFAQGLCGTDVLIQSLPEVANESDERLPRARVEADGRTIALPAIIRRCPTREENVRLYMVMTAHEAGHLEFGTYRMDLAAVCELGATVGARYRPGACPSIQALGDLFALYPQPGLIRDLWTVLEDARVEYRLQHEYPGLRRDLSARAREAVQTRSLLHGLSAREMVVDGLLLLSTAGPGTVLIPESLAPIVERIWALTQTILTPIATATDAIRLADRLYVVLDEMMAPVERAGEDDEAARESDIGPGPKASETTSGDYRPVTHWAYRGDMNPDLVRERNAVAGGEAQTAAIDAGTAEFGSVLAVTDMQEAAARESLRAPRASKESTDGDRFGPGHAPSSIEDLLTVGLEPREGRAPVAGAGSEIFYDEWDGRIRDYRTRWCRVVERMGLDRDTAFADATLAAHAPLVRLLRRYFEGIRPPALRRVLRQSDGEDIDVDAAIGRVIDRMAGAEPTDRVYVRREKKERDVAVAFLVDLSGSTSRQIEPNGRRVIDVEKESLVLLSQALDAVGDQYAIYGYSGQGRHQVEFVVLKDFDEPGARMAPRLGDVSPRNQNRDGAAIRHAGAKILARDARVRLLVLVSDGKPLDDGYAEEYALEDTKVALREIQRRGVHPFCVTVDREADPYLKRMYGDVRFTVIDHVQLLPERLPRVYHRLTA